jgi:hypothetical protein
MRVPETTKKIERSVSHSHSLVHPILPSSTFYSIFYTIATDADAENSNNKNTIDVKAVNTTTADHNDNDNNDDNDDQSETASLEIGACCLCHCALDYSDRAAFFKDDRCEDYKLPSTNKTKQEDSDSDDSASDSGSDSENDSQDNDGSKDKDGNDGDDENGNDGNKNEDMDTVTDDKDKSKKAGASMNDNDKEDAVSNASSEYFFRPDDPYITADGIYDAHNALVYCDTEGCNRMYHQKCHFVPVLTLPRGAWHCLICTCQQAAAAAAKKKKKTRQTPPKSGIKAVAGKGTGTTTKTIKAAAAAGLEPTITTCDYNDNDEKQQLQILQNTQDLFRSPPVDAARPAEIQWEYASRHYKAQQWRTELHQRLKQAVSSQTGNYRLGVMAAETLTSTQKNRRHFSKHGGSQELAQSLVKLFGAKFKLREFCHNLEKVRRSSGKPWRRLQAWTDEWIATNKNNQDRNDFVERVLFPFGRQYPCRVDPRTPEMKLVQREQADANKDPEKISSVPAEIIVSTVSAASAGVGVDKKGKEKGGKRNKGAPSSKSACPAGVGSKKSHTAGKKTTGNAKDDDDSGISLDDLKCCVCHQGTATDDNDLILCDGGACYRAYHMKCCKPEITAEDLEDENDDWFCPICSCLADLLLLIQGEYMGDEWEQRRYGLQLDGKDTTGSVKSWDAVDDVFPESEWEYETACLLKEGKCNTATKQLLAQVLGLDSLPVDEDHDDVEEDAHFDPSAFDAERRRAREALEQEEADEDSSHSSQATLADMADVCVEMEIGKDELAALSEQDDEDDDSSEQESESGSREKVRRSRRIRKHDSTNASSDGDPGRFDESNIVEGKRGRKPVDYKKLNEAIFGDLPDTEAAKIDDTDDFEIKETRKKVSKSSDDESGEEDDDDDENNAEDEQNTGASEEKPPHKKSRKHEPPVEQEDDSNAPKEDRKKTAKVAKSKKAAPSSTAPARSNGANASPSIAQAALNMVSKLVGGSREGRRRKR